MPKTERHVVVLSSPFSGTMRFIIKIPIGEDPDHEICCYIEEMGIEAEWEVMEVYKLANPPPTG